MLLAVWTQPRDRRCLYSVIQDVKVSWKPGGTAGWVMSHTGILKQPQKMADVKKRVDFLQGPQTSAASETESLPPEVRYLEKLIAVMEKSLLTLTSFISSWILYQKAPKGLRTLSPLGPHPGKYQSWRLFLVVNEGTFWPRDSEGANPERIVEVIIECVYYCFLKIHNNLIPNHIKIKTNTTFVTTWNDLYLKKK